MGAAPVLARQDGEADVTQQNGVRRSPPGDVQAVLRDGRAAHGSAMVLRLAARPDGGPAGVTVIASRKVGGAVTRNRAKRRLREAIRRVEVPVGIDVVVVARGAALTAPLPSLVSELDGLLARAAGGAAS
jgi:ribonuclease P protein component